MYEQGQQAQEMRCACATKYESDGHRRNDGVRAERRVERFDIITLPWLHGSPSVTDAERRVERETARLKYSKSHTSSLDVQ